MKSLSLLRKATDYSSILWIESECCGGGVRFAIRRPSLEQRMRLTKRVRELALKHEFLTSGDTADQLAGALSELLVRKLYLEWGLVEIKGLKIDGEHASTENLVERGPEDLVEEIINAIKTEAGLTDEERKNS